AMYGSQGSGRFGFLAASSVFLEEWLPDAHRLCAGFGERRAGVQCPACVFARPFGRGHVAVVQVADQGTDDAGRPGALGFRLLVLPRSVYVEGIGDPFIVADQFPPLWHARGELPVLSWPAEPLPPRTVEEVQRILQRVKGSATEETPQSPVLLGGVQALVDGSRLVFERPAPDTDLLRSLWTLLPQSTRCHLWPASFAFGNALAFDVLVVPRASGEEYAGYLTGEQAGDYPEGRYELSLQIAAEAGDQRELDALFARRSRAQTFRLGLIVLAGMTVLLLVMKVLTVALPRAPQAGPNREPEKPEKPPSKAEAPLAPPKLALPPPQDYAALTEPQRELLLQALYDLAERMKVPVVWEPATLETLLMALDAHLGTPDPRRDPGALSTWGPPHRQLQALLWKHDVDGYDDRRLNAVELVERLGRKLAAKSANR